MTPLKTLKGRNTTDKLRSCIHYHRQVSSYKSFFLKCLLTTSTSKSKYKQPSKEKTKLMHTRLRKKKVQMEIGNRCVSKDGHGSEKLCHTILRLTRKVFRAKLPSMQRKAFQSQKTDWRRSSMNSIWIAKLIIKSQWSSFLRLHGKNFSFVLIWKTSFLTLTWTLISRLFIKSWRYASSAMSTVSWLPWLKSTTLSLDTFILQLCWPNWPHLNL